MYITVVLQSTTFFPALQNKSNEADNQHLFALQEDNASLKKRLKSLEHEVQSSNREHLSTKNKYEEELLQLRKKVRDTEAKYTSLASTPPKVGEGSCVIFSVFKSNRTCVPRRSGP